MCKHPASCLPSVQVPPEPPCLALRDHQSLFPSSRRAAPWLHRAVRGPCACASAWLLKQTARQRPLAAPRPPSVCEFAPRSLWPGLCILGSAEAASIGPSASQLPGCCCFFSYSLSIFKNSYINVHILKGPVKWRDFRKRKLFIPTQNLPSFLYNALVCCCQNE